MTDGGEAVKYVNGNPFAYDVIGSRKVLKIYCGQYGESYHELNGDQKKEVDEYLKNHLNKQGRDVSYTYAPSNHAKDELNAHTKTLEVSSLGLFVISFEKETYYRSEALILYERMYEKSLMIEREYGYTPEGYKF